jgi:hypothetical protein
MKTFLRILKFGIGLGLFWTVVYLSSRGLTSAPTNYFNEDLLVSIVGLIVGVGGLAALYYRAGQISRGED